MATVRDKMDSWVVKYLWTIRSKLVLDIDDSYIKNHAEL